MPAPLLPPELKKVVNSFVVDNRKLLTLPEVKLQVNGLTDFGRSLRTVGDVQVLLPDPQPTALSAQEWLMRVPEALLAYDASPMLSLKGLSLKDAHLALVDSLQVLTLGIKTLFSAGVAPPKSLSQALLQVAFGADAASTALRKPMIDRKAPGLPPPPGPDQPSLPGLPELPDLDRLVREGTLLELVRSFAECGYAAQMERDWVAAVLPFGHVAQLKADPPCGGNQLWIRYDQFGPRPPAPEQVADILVALPTRQGCTHVSLRALRPDFFNPAQWADAGKLSLPLPADVVSGPVGFFATPPAYAGDGPCTGGSLATAAGMFQSLMDKYFGPVYGAQFGQIVVNIASRAEAGRHRPLPCASLQADALNQLEAGSPYIDRFAAVEQGPIHPRGSITLTWSTANAQTVEIVARAVPGSEHPHELPVVAGPLPASGRVTLQVPCSRRWEGQYVLRASNQNGCTAEPMEAVVPLRSGYSHYRVACAKANITDARPGLGMAGFAYPRQKTSGLVLSEQFARAYVVEENSASATRQRLVMVVADIWTCTQILKREVLLRVNQRFNRPANNPLLTDANLLIAGTHTHAGPGGYSEYALYNLTCGGFDQGVFDTLADGITNAVVNALARVVPGRLYMNAAELPDVGANRSFAAYQRNPEYAAGADITQWTDREMLLLKFVADVDNRGGQQPVGALNWHALHATSLGQFNTRISGDNKGHAEWLFEQWIQQDPQRGASGFVAAFGNACAGDVSGNLELDDQGRETSFKPLGGELVMLDVLPQVVGLPLDGAVFPPLTRAPDAWQRDQDRMRLLGQRQFEHALKLFDSASKELTGPLGGVSLFVDMGTGVPILNQPGARTWPASLGVSFGAGSTADSIAYASLGPLDIDAAIVEGVSRAEFTAGGIEAWGVGLALLGVQAPVMALALSTGVPPVGPVLSAVMQALALMPALPLARSYFFGSLAPLLLPGQFADQVPSLPGKEVEWDIPLPDTLSSAYVAGQGDKPVMFPVGLTRLKTRLAGASVAVWTHVDCPMVPNVIPMQLLRIGGLAVAAVPAEFTSTAGRRLKEQVHKAFGGQLSQVAISNYSNGYSGYVATPEEYSAQHYEGASTLYGPHTLAAYVQTFEALCIRLQGGVAPALGECPPYSVPAVFHKVAP